MQQPGTNRVCVAALPFWPKGRPKILDTYGEKFFSAKIFRVAGLHRIGAALKKQLSQLEREMNKGLK
jgi:hypothetical protein